VGFFDSKGQFFRTPQEATLSDLANMLGRMGDGDSLAPGIAKILFDKRRDLEHIFRDHDDMLQGRATDAQSRAEDPAKASNVTPINPAKSA
jgi:hypothetical protein